MAVTVPGDEEETIAITGKRHPCHPYPALPTTSVLVPDIGLRDKRSCFRYELRDDLLGRDINANHGSSVVEKITMAAESSVHDVTTLEQGLDPHQLGGTSKVHVGAYSPVSAGRCPR